MILVVDNKNKYSRIAFWRQWHIAKGLLGKDFQQASWYIFLLGILFMS